jgi:DNA-binding NarL/FixJ family response regulator
MSPVRCVVVDDHPALLHVLSSALGEGDLDVCATANDGRRAVEAVHEHAPDVVVADYRLPSLAGAELVAAIREAAPEAQVVVYTGDADQKVWAEALAAGARGLVLKDAPLADLRRAIDTVLAGRTYLDPTLAAHALTDTPAEPALTPREVDVLTLLAEGLSHEEIGTRLAIGTETVRTHVRKATDRLGASTRTQAVALALRKGLIT